MSKPSPMVLAAARALSNRQAEACGVDAEDMWKTYPDVFIEDAQAALEAAGTADLVAALRAARDAWGQPELPSVQINAALLKATGSTS